MTMANGLHISTPMNLSRRGGHLACNKIEPGNADGNVQAPRQYLIGKNLDRPKWWKRKDKSGGEVQ